MVVGKKDFIKTFDNLARYQSRHNVFSDFVTMSAVSLHNAVRRDEALEKEYLSIAARYDKEKLHTFAKLLGNLVSLMGDTPEDTLGELYMSLELGNSHIGQFFTPSSVSDLMAQLLNADHDLTECLKTQPFVTVSDPACGAGGTILSYAKQLIYEGYNPSDTMWVYAQDVDRKVALMCYLQMALWNIPGVVVVGNTLAMEVKEKFYTPAHYLFGWGRKLREKHEEKEKFVKKIVRKRTWVTG